MKVYGELEYADLHNLSADPSAGKIGRIYWQTTTGKVMVDDGTNIYAMLRNDGKLIIGNHGTAANNIRAHRGASAVLQFVLGNDVTAEGTLSTALGQISAKFETYTDAGKPTAGNPGRVAWISDLLTMKVDNGTNWVSIGGSGAGGINYISENNGNSDFEFNADGYSAYADAAGTSPVDGTGGSANVTITRTITNPLRGTGSGLITKDAANRQGQGISRVFTVARADRAKVLAIEFEYEIASGTFVSGDSSDLRIWIKPLDGSDTSLIQPTPYTIQGGAGIHRFKSMFQSTSDATQYRIIFHIATTSASAWTFKFDDLYVGPDTTKALLGAPISDWVPYTPTFDGFGTVTGISFFSRRVGDSLQIQGYAVAGTVTASGATVTLGYNGVDGNVVIDSARLPTATPGSLALVGTMTVGAAGANTYGWTVLADGGNNYLNFGYQSAGSGGISNQIGTGLLPGNGLDLTFFAQVPILGWSSTVQMSHDVDNRIVAAKCIGTGGSDILLTGTVSPYQFDSVEYDTHGSVTTGSGWKFTARVSGKYLIFGNMYQVANGTDVYLYKNGVTTNQIIGNFLNANASNKFGTTVQLNAGDYIELRPQGDCTQADNALYNHIEISRLSGPAAIAASETVAARYYEQANTNFSTASVFSYSNKDFDTHGAYDPLTGIFTVPVAGIYEVTAAISASGGTNFPSAGNYLQVAVAKNTVYKSANRFLFVAASTGSNPMVVATSLIRCEAGDQIAAYVDFTGPGGPSTDSAPEDNFIQIKKI
jgi:hypothetical protein